MCAVCSDGDVLPALLLAAPLAAGLAYYSLAHIRWLWHLIGPSRPGQARFQPVPVGQVRLCRVVRLQLTILAY